MIEATYKLKTYNPGTSPTSIHDPRSPTLTKSTTLKLLIRIKFKLNLNTMKCVTWLKQHISYNISVCSLNPRSVKNKTISLCDYIVSNDFDVIALTETWLGSTIDETCLRELVPNGYSIKHIARNGKKRGGVALVYKSAITLRIISSTRDNEFKNFEHMDCSLIVNGFHCDWQSYTDHHHPRLTV